MTLIEMVRQARKEEYKWIAIDSDGEVFAYASKPFIVPALIKNKTYWNADYLYMSSMLCEGYKLTCDWKDALIDVSKVLCK